jgi:succinoglycan biosynthesis protein ExoV
VIEKIRSARLVLAEAMHAAIVADSLRVPWIAVSSSPKVSSFKWLDWTQSMELPYLPLRLPASTVDAAWRNLMLWSYDAVHRFPPSADPLVLYASRYRRERGALFSAVNRSGRRLHRRGERAIRGPSLSRLRKGADERRIDRAAAALLAACRSAGMMSSEKIFGRRLDMLVERLRALN